MNLNKTIEDIQRFLVIYSQLVSLIDISELTRIVIFKICEFIQEELINKNRLEIASECFLVLYTIKELCVNESEISQINLCICTIEQIFQAREPNVVSPAVPDVPPDLKRLNLDKMIYIKNLFNNNISEFTRAKVDLVMIKNQNMALKIYEIPASRTQDIDRVYKEARIYQRLNSSNCIYFLRYYGIHFERTIQYETNISMVKLTLGIEYCRVSLANKINEKFNMRIRFKPKKIYKFIYNLILGYLIMRDLGVIHQDIKPDNIMIGDDGIIKIIDFDVSYFKMSGVTFTGKKISSVVGTRGYYSPEKLRCLMNRNVDAPEFKYDPEHSDIFSLGLIFYQMITLREEISYMKVSDLHNHIDQYTDIDQNIRTLVKKMLAENPGDRVYFAEAITMVNNRYNN